MEKLIIFTDMGDTIVDEATQVFDGNGDVVLAEPIDNAIQMLKTLKESGHTIALVADGTVKSFENIIDYLGIHDVFDTKVISESLGTRKPDLLMFQKALDNLNLQEDDKKNIIMFGNNLKRDILGANEFGIGSVWLRRFPRYTLVPEAEVEIPDHIIRTPDDLINLVKYIESTREVLAFN
ncbi:HAD family hydrolase [Enterococcus asini]|uniref:HAD family hydrolase n=1 Tax=Enterococcus asini TaxID=57732 RepID=A0AAW8TVJ7_9ENTE|nr:HAD family hydrolase [Enterococcus asini]MDT2808972.1 HAD family hydrolase [Enterococcus asini]